MPHEILISMESDGAHKLPTRAKEAVKYFSLNTHLIINPYYYCSFGQVNLKHK